MKNKGILYLLLMVVWGMFQARVVWADPPFQTDDPETVEVGHWQFYLAATFTQVQGGRTGTAPQLEINYGPMRDIQLHLIVSNAFNAANGLNTTLGLGDTEMGVKYRFIEETTDFPQVAFYPLVELPTGDNTKGLGDGQTQLLLPIWIQKSWGTFESYGGGGYWINPGPGNKNWFYYGWAVQKDLSPELMLGAELIFHTSPQIGGADHIGWNVGGILHLDKQSHLLLSMGRDIIQGDVQFAGYLGYLLTL